MYSRPGSSTVNALARVPTPNSIDIIGSKKVTHSAHGRYMDFRSPKQLQENATARAAEVTGFIEGLTKVAQPLIADALTKQANQQVGELLQTQSPIDLLRSGDATQQGLVRSLSPQAQDILKDKQAQASSYAYAEMLSAERLKRKGILQNVASTPEQIAKAEAEAKAAAMEASGFNRVDPSYMVRHSDLAMKTEAALRGQDYKARVKAQDDISKNNYGGGLIASLRQLSEMRVEYAKAGQTEAFVTQLKANIEQSLAEAPFVQGDLANIYGERITTEIASLTQAKRYEDAWNMLQLLEGAAKVNPQAPGGGNFFDFKMQNGVPLRHLISKLQDEIYDEKETWDREQYLLGNMDTLQRLAAGEEVDPALIQSAILSAKDPKQLAAFSQLADSMENFGGRVTPADQAREAQFRMELEDAKRQPDFDKAQWFEEAKARGLKPSQLLRLTAPLNEEHRPDSAVAVTGVARSDMDDLTTNAAANVALEAGGDIKERKLEAQIFASKETQKILETMIAEGKSPTRDQAAQIYQNALEGWARQTVNGRAKGASSTPAGQVQIQFMELESNLQKTRGEWTLNAFPKTVVDGWRSQNGDKDPTVRDLQKFMVRLGMAKGADGKPIIPNVEQRLRQMSIQASPNGQAPGGQPEARPGRMSLLGGVGAKENFGITKPQQGSSNTPAKAKPQASQGKEQASAGGGETNPVVALAIRGLESVARAITPPAAAGTLDSVRNQEAIETLGKLWTGKERVRMSTPPLPQVDAQVQTASAPLAITSDKHPIFVAIGIAEGTRTANGGYTKAYRGHRDPGNGVWNVGTVSGQQGGSPQSSDRRWMARLTRQASSVAPIMRRMGLQPGTQGWNRVLFNVLDLTVQAPLAATDFIKKLPQVARAGFSVEAIAKARADSFYNPRTGRLEASGFGNSYQRLFQDQRSRAGVWDYRRRI